jgi:hypothetical protein
MQRPSSSAGSSSPPPPPPARSHVWEERERFMNDAKADVATDGVVSLDPERRERFVADIVGRVRVSVANHSHQNKINGDEDEQMFHNGLDAIH